MRPDHADLSPVGQREGILAVHPPPHSSPWLREAVMKPSPSRDDMQRIRTLAGLPDEIRQSRFAAVTRLTVLKSLCREPERAHRFVAYLARRTFEAMKEPKGRSAEPTTTESSHRQMMAQALEGMDAWLRSPGEKTRRTLSALHDRMRDEQNEHRDIPFGSVRLITDANLLLFEYALSCVLAHERDVGTWAYQTARQYAERYTPSEGTGLISSSIPFVRDIVDFWTAEYDLSPESLAPIQKAEKTEALPADATKSSRDHRKVTFTARQGQFLAFIHLYRKLHHRGPAESDLRAYFGVTAPAVHGMVVKLEELGLITREPGVARSMRVAVPADRLPELEATDGPPW